MIPGSWRDVTPDPPDDWPSLHPYDIELAGKVWRIDTDIERMIARERRARDRADERYARRVEAWVDVGFVLCVIGAAVCAIIAL